MLENTPTQSTMTESVSYTHLDVYKRQILCDDPDENGRTGIYAGKLFLLHTEGHYRLYAVYHSVQMCIRDRILSMGCNEIVRSGCYTKITKQIWRF